MEYLSQHKLHERKVIDRRIEKSQQADELSGDLAVAHVEAATVIYSQAARVMRSRRKFRPLGEPLHDRPVGAAKSVDRLLDIADDEQRPFRRERVLDQHAYVRPLNGRGILKLIDKKMKHPF